MTDTAIFLLGAAVIAVSLAGFVYSVIEMKRLQDRGTEASPRSGA